MATPMELVVTVSDARMSTCLRCGGHDTPTASVQTFTRTPHGTQEPVRPPRTVQPLTCPDRGASQPDGETV